MTRGNWGKKIELNCMTCWQPNLSGRISHSYHVFLPASIWTAANADAAAASKLIYAAREFSTSFDESQAKFCTTRSYTCRKKGAAAREINQAANAFSTHACIQTAEIKREECFACGGQSNLRLWIHSSVTALFDSFIQYFYFLLNPLEGDTAEKSYYEIRNKDLRYLSSGKGDLNLECR